MIRCARHIIEKQAERADRRRQRLSADRGERRRTRRINGDCERRIPDEAPVGVRG